MSAIRWLMLLPWLPSLPDTASDKELPNDEAAALSLAISPRLDFRAGMARVLVSTFGSPPAPDHADTATDDPDVKVNGVVPLLAGVELDAMVVVVGYG